MFRRVTLQNGKLRDLVRDLRFHHDPVGGYLRPIPVLPMSPVIISDANGNTAAPQLYSPW